MVRPGWKNEKAGLPGHPPMQKAATAKQSRQQLLEVPDTNPWGSYDLHINTVGLW